MQVNISPRQLHGEIKTVASKSQAHRMLICAAFADKATDIVCEELSLDIEATAGCLSSMGADISYDKEMLSFHVVPVSGRAAALTTPISEGTADADRSSAQGIDETIATDASSKTGNVSGTSGSAAECSQDAEGITIDVGESGSTLRFILPVVAALGINTHIVMHGRLSERPLSPLWEELEAHGVKLTKNADSTMDVAGKLTGSHYKIAADVSSQFISGLLFAAPLITDKDSDFELELTGNIESLNYILMTIDALSSFGVEVERSGNVLRISRDAAYTSPGELKVEGDWSNGAFWICASALTADTLNVTGLRDDSVQGDKEVLKLKDAIVCGRAKVGEACTDVKGKVDNSAGKASAAWKTDAAAEAESVDKATSEISAANAADLPAADITGANDDSNTEYKCNQEPVIIDARNVPDLVPVLSVLASGVKGETVFTHAERLRIKESDRIKATVTMLKALGADAEETEDGLRVRGTGRKLRGGIIDSCNDHRIAMSAAVASIICESDVTVLTAQAVRKSYPAFWEDFARVGGCVTLTDDAVKA